MSALSGRRLLHSSRWRTIGVVVSSVLLLAGCGSESAPEAPATETTTSSSSSTRATTSKSTTTEATPEAEAAQSATPTAVAPEAAGPTLVECIYGGGAWTENGWLSDGSNGYHPECAALRSEQLVRNPYRCPKTDHQVADLSECLNPGGISVSPELQDDPSVETPGEADEADAPPVEPGAGEESGLEP